jgi:hypothetical protein
LKWASTRAAKRGSARAREDRRSVRPSQRRSPLISVMSLSNRPLHRGIQSVRDDWDYHVESVGMKAGAKITGLIARACI